MGNIRHPRKGSMQYWPRKRSRHTLVRVRHWADESKVKLLGFVAVKAGMTHVQFTDTRAKSNTKGETVSIPVTILECPPLLISGVSFYKNSLYGLIKSASIWAGKLEKNLGRTIPLPKKQGKSIDDIKDFDDLRLVVQTLPENVAPTGTKKPKLIEIALGGKKEDKLNFAKSILGKQIAITDVFEPGNLVDIRGVTKGKGFQGTVKRYGVQIRSHKAEKTKRGIGSLGGWTPKRVEFSVAQSGKMGYHQRTEYNKKIVKIGHDGTEVNRAGGLDNYGLVKNSFVLVHGSVVGPVKREVLLTAAERIKKVSKEVPDINYISK